MSNSSLDDLPPEFTGTIITMNGICAQHHIVDNLYLGGYPQGMTMYDNQRNQDIKYIVTCCGHFPWGEKTRNFTLKPGQISIATEFEDCAKLPDPDYLRGLADLVNNLRKSGPVLVHCAAGLNRSGLVAGLALVRSGMQPIDAIKLLRTKRDSLVLFNNTFREWLLQQPTIHPEA